MKAVVVPLQVLSADPPGDPTFGDPGGGQGLPWARVQAAITEAVGRGAAGVVFTGAEPLRARHLLRAIAAAKAAGLRTCAVTDGRALADDSLLGRVLAAGLDAVTVGLHAVDPAVHDALAGEGRHALTLAGLRAAAASPLTTTLRVALAAPNLGALPDLCALAATLSVPVAVHAVRTGPHAPAPHAALAALRDGIDAAARAGVALTWHGFRPLSAHHTIPNPRPADADLATRALLRTGLVDSRLRAGLAAGVSPAALAPAIRATPEQAPRLLRAIGVDVDRGPDPAPIDRNRAVHVLLDPACDDPLASVSGLAALADALDARGLVVARHTAWRGSAGPDGLPVPPRFRLPAALRSDRRPDVPWGLSAAEASDALDALCSTLDLGGAGTIVVRSLTLATRLRARGIIPRAARLVVIDADPWSDAPYHPADTDLLVTAMPWRLSAWAARGVRLDQVLAHPPLVDRRVLPERASRGGVVVLAGAAFDDTAWAPVARALGAPAVRLGRGPDTLPALPDDPRARLRALSEASWLVVPHRDHRADAWTIGWLARAAALAVPAVSTATRAIDALYQPGEAIVAPHPSALADAWADATDAFRDDATARLRARRPTLDADVLAARLLGGRAPALPPPW